MRPADAPARIESDGKRQTPRSRHGFEHVRGAVLCDPDIIQWNAAGAKRSLGLFARLERNDEQPSAPGGCFDICDVRKLHEAGCAIGAPEHEDMRGADPVAQARGPGRLAEGYEAKRVGRLGAAEKDGRQCDHRRAP
jgi:hypothetical protein